MSTAKPGDTVQLTTDTKTYEGILMPRPEIYEKGITVLKLPTGYNLGISDKKITKTTVITKYSEPKQKTVTHTHNKNLPTVAILSCGGTIASKLDYRTGGVVGKYTADDFIAMMPELLDIANITSEAVSETMSEDMAYADWKLIANAIYKQLQDDSIKGVVVTCGTDSLHYISAALSFFLQDINKPVIITAAQRSIDRGSSDAFLNLICATKAACEFNGTLVSVCMHETTNDDSCILMRGSKVRKMHTSRRDAFRPINEQPLARITPNEITIINKNYPSTPNTKPTRATDFEEKIGLVYVHPLMQASEIDIYVQNKYKGLVVAGTALGHVPKQLVAPLAKAKKAGLHIIICSQTLYGRTHPFVYSRLREQSIKHKFFFAQDILPEVALVKLGWALGQSTTVESLFEKNICGEYTTEIDERSFLL
ncbi:MAG: glutamyl-tRNA(Gln) amidotransferase subunit D [Candidatus Woesearchaeota archaeon]|jgi:glutamyl-tRNA(Gln) amidotransferase subunit D